MRFCVPIPCFFRNVSFEGGCHGNLQGNSKLVEGMTVEKLVELLEGNTCGENYTSCADQLVQGVKAAYAEQKAKG